MRIFTMFVLLLVAGCHLKSPSAGGSSSGLSQLSSNEFKCKVWDAPRIELIKAKVTGYSTEFNNGASKFSQKYFNAMAGIPDTYLDWMATRVASDKFRIYTASIPKGMSLTSYGGGKDSIMVDPTNWGFDYSLQHEVGHYIEVYIKTDSAQQRGYTQQQFHDELMAVAKAAYTNPKLNSYPKLYYSRAPESYYAEFWAEAFNSYYCSEEANQDFAQSFPEVYSFVSRYLEAPVWKGSGGLTPSRINVLTYIDKRTPSTLSAYFAGPMNMTSLSICYDTAEACKANNGNSISVPRATQQTNYASFFYLKDMSAALNVKQIYLSGLNQTNQVVLTRQITLQQK